MEFKACVLQVIPRLEAGGAERTTVEMARAIVAAGGRALVASEGGRLAADLAAVGGELRVLPAASKNPATLLANRRRLMKLIRAEGVDIVHARSRAPAWSALWAARATGKPFVTTYHGAYSGTAPWKRLYNSVMARGDLVIANSEFTRAEILSRYGASTRPLVVIPRGADLARFDATTVAPARVAALSAAWDAGAAPGALRVLLPGRLTSWKGQDVLIDAAVQLAATRHEGDFRLILAGEAQGRGAYAQGLRARIREQGVETMVGLPGHCDDMPAAYLWADAVVSASTRPEAFGRIAVEAQAMGRPVIATDHGGARETVVEGETGFLVPPGDPGALAEALLRLKRMPPAARGEMGERARERARAHFSTAAMTAATLDAYRKVLS